MVPTNKLNQRNPTSVENTSDVTNRTTGGVPTRSNPGITPPSTTNTPTPNPSIPFLNNLNLFSGAGGQGSTSSATGGTETKTAPIYNPYQDSEGVDWSTHGQHLLSSLKFDPSSFETRMGKDGRYEIYSGGNKIAVFGDESRMQSFISQYSQGWQQRQGAVTPLESYQALQDQYTWQSPNVNSPQVQTEALGTAGTDTRIFDENGNPHPFAQEIMGMPDGQLNDWQRYVKEQVNRSKEFVSKDTGQLGDAPDVQALMAELSKADSPEAIQTALAQAAQSAGGMEALMQQIAPALGQVSQNSQIEAAQAQMAKESTVRGQMEELMASFEDGNPPWATGPMRAANAIMAQRGLSASSMAGAAITNAVMEATLPIAMADAQTSAEFQFRNLSNLQQARIQNAQSFLSMDMANLNNAQQTQIFKAQQRSQALLSDVAAQNAASQFNASSQNQTNQFMAQLATQVQQFNAQQANALSQFNAGEANALSQFKAQMQNQRDQFNANNRLVIDQANAQWRQQITTLNNATINEANRINASNLLAVNLAEFNNISQSRRDAMNYAYTSSESAKDRAMQIVLAQISADATTTSASIRTDAGDSGSSGLVKAAGLLLGSIFGD